MKIESLHPSIHAMAKHVGEFLEEHNSIVPFTQQGLEKINDVMTKDFFRGTCYGNDALLQIIQKLNCLEYFQDQHISPSKIFEIECSNCKQKGHNLLTCR